MGNKVILVDGHSILNRAFYGIPDLTNGEGLHTNAVYGFLTILLKQIEDERPDYLAVAFDMSAPTFRHEIFKEYKGTRKPMPPELKEQVPLMREVLSAMRVPIFEQLGLEADDIIGTLASRLSNEGTEVLILSGDRDLLQLATDTVKIRIPKTKMGKTIEEDYYASDVRSRYAVSPKAFIDLKALMGDSSDNIPGVPGIGEKTATKLISGFESLDGVYENLDEVKPDRIKNLLSENKDLAYLSQQLATICVDANISYELEDMKIGNLFTEEALQIFRKLQFRALINRAKKDYGSEVKPDKITESFVLIDNKNSAAKVLEKAAEADMLALSLYYSTKQILPLFANEAIAGGLGICFSKDEAYLVLDSAFPDNLTWKEWVSNLKKDRKQTLILFDAKAFAKEAGDINKKACFDALIAAYLLNPLKSDYSIEDIARERLDLFWDDSISDKDKACYCALTLFRSHCILKEKLEKSEMYKLFTDIEMPLAFVLLDMEREGVAIEEGELKEYGKKLGVRITELEREIYDDAGETFNINSPKQLGVILFDKLGLKGGKKTKTGYSTSADVLEKLSEEAPIVDKILEYRQLAKLKSTYADGLIHCVALDGRIHGTFNQTVTATGRLSSTEPNLQNIPVRMELGKLIRKVFVPREGYTFVDADYSQIELRILAHCSGDEQLINAYKEAEDIHRLTASQVFHVPFDEVTDLQRRNAKAVNFGIVYGISSFGLSQGLSITRKEAQDYIEHYFQTYPGVKAFLDKAVSDAKEKGYAITLFGRRRPVPELSSSNYQQRSFGERVAMNSPIQGTAADIIKIAMIGVAKRLKDENLKSRLVLQVHDELLIEAHDSEIKEVKRILKEEMEGAASLLVPLDADIHEGKNWYDAK
ncbi:MAG: DNA polymerase I [Lachnospiraceae bacterium]|jgi:DNA polymerase-1|nr:DNA polymerase I [Lachnospiraceae bacterium]